LLQGPLVYDDGVTLKAKIKCETVFELTAHACAGAAGKWSGTVVLHAVDGDQTFPIAWAFPAGGTVATARIGPITVTSSGTTITGMFNFTIRLVTNHGGSPGALVFDLSEDIAAPSAATYPMNAIYSNLGVPIPLSHDVGKACR
jgi:hypothetical protein